jgi:UDP-N-acetylmuramate dehydrogenase
VNAPPRRGVAETPDLADRLAEVAAALGPRATRSAPLGARTTYRVGGPAAVLVEAQSEGDLEALQRVLADGPVPVLVVGKGSNLLVADAGFDGVAVVLGEAFSALEMGSDWVRAGAAAGLPVLARRSVEAGLRGLEWAVGVPGSVGGALRMNAGGHGSDIASCLVRYAAFDLLRGTRTEDGPDRLALGYRRSSLAPSEVVLWAELAAQPGGVTEGREAIAEIVRWRRGHQPGGSNAGSVFTNPSGDAAGRLVEAAGLRGHRLGTAHVSEKHANFIQADDGGSAGDVLALIRHVQRVVAERFGIELVPEVRMIGFEP